MGNDEAFRKIRDKLAGFESDYREDSWHVFEKHRIGKERRRRWAGALFVGVLMLFISGVLIGYRIVSQHTGVVGRPPGKSGTFIPKRRAEAEIIRAGAATGLQSPATGLGGGKNKRTASNGISGRPRVQAGHNMPSTVPAVSGPAPVPNDPPVAFSGSGARLSVIHGIRPEAGPLFYDVKLPLPCICQTGGDTVSAHRSTVRGFQLSAGPAIRANYTKPSENSLTVGPAVFGTFSVRPGLALRGGLALMREHVTVSNANPRLSANAVKWLSRGHYRWWDLEIPIDMQVTLHRRPGSSLAGLLGVSSSVYWGGRFQEVYRKDKLVTTTLVLHDGQIMEVQDVASKQDGPVTGHSNGLVFAPATYLSASMIFERKLAARSSVAIEPQFRYPIGGVTSHNLKFTSIGLQIRVLYK